MLRVCRAAGLRLRDVLLGDLEAVRASEAPEGRPYVAPSIETHRALDPGEMQAILRAAMAASPPPSLASLFADASVDRSYARRRWPRECASIRERRREWLARQRALVRAERTRQIIAAVESLTEIGIYPSRNQMKELIHGVWLRRPEFEAAWKDAVVANGWGDPSDLRRLKGSPTPTPSRQ